MRISDWSSDVCSSDLACLQHRIDAFDDRIHTPQKGSRLPIRLVPFGIADEAILAAKLLLDGGFYVSAVFFPTVPRGAAGLRICLTASHAQEDIRSLCGLIDAAQAWRAFDPAAPAGGLPFPRGPCRQCGRGTPA